MVDLIWVLIVLAYYFAVCFICIVAELGSLGLVFRLLGLCLLSFLIAFQLGGCAWLLVGLCFIALCLVLVVFVFVEFCVVVLGLIGIRLLFVVCLWSVLIYMFWLFWLILCFGCFGCFGGLVCGLFRVCWLCFTDVNSVEYLILLHLYRFIVYLCFGVGV